MAPSSIAAITFNKRAAEELGARLDAAVEPLGVSPRTVRVRTFHAIGREILRDAGVAVESAADVTVPAANPAPADSAGGADALPIEVKAPVNLE